VTAALPVDNRDEEAIRRLVREQAEAWCRGDAEGYASTAGDDLGFTNIRGQRWVGRQTFVDVHRKIFDGIFAGSQLVMEVERVTFPGSATAVAELALRLTGAKAMPPGIAADPDGVLRTRLLEVFELRRGTWTLVVCHNTAVLTDPRHP
jgi:uncharacterized protein (TIGR02246 family)